METSTDEKQEETLDIMDNVRPPRKTVAAGTYRAVYTGFRAFMDDTPWGKKRAVRLNFRIWEGDYKGTWVSFKGLRLKTNEGKGVIGGKSKLADKVRKLTKGELKLTKDQEGVKAMVQVENRESKKVDEETGKKRVYDYIDDFILDPDQTPLPEDFFKRKDDESGKPAEGKAATGSQAKAGGSRQDELLDGLDELADYEA